MYRIRFHIRMDKCIGCPSCVTACREEHDLPPRADRRRVGEMLNTKDPEDELRYFLSTACNHCIDPACLKGCPSASYRILENGIVWHNPDTCIGCGQCVLSCPYGVPVIRDDTGTVTKCDFCLERQQRGEEPACIESCPSGALILEKVYDPQKVNYLDEGKGPQLPDPGFTKSSTKITIHKKFQLEDLVRSFRPAVRPLEPHVSLILFTLLFSFSFFTSISLFVLQWMQSRPFTPACFALTSDAFFAKLSCICDSSFCTNYLASVVLSLLSIAGAFFHLRRKERFFYAIRGFRHSEITAEGLSAFLFSIFLLLFVITDVPFFFGIAFVSGFAALFYIIKCIWFIDPLSGNSPDGLLFLLPGLFPLLF